MSLSSGDALGGGAARFTWRGMRTIGVDDCWTGGSPALAGAVCAGSLMIAAVITGCGAAGMPYPATALESAGGRMAGRVVRWLIQNAVASSTTAPNKANAARRGHAGIRRDDAL